VKSGDTIDTIAAKFKGGKRQDYPHSNGTAGHGEIQAGDVIDYIPDGKKDEIVRPANRAVGLGAASICDVGRRLVGY